MEHMPSYGFERNVLTMAPRHAAPEPWYRRTTATRAALVVGAAVVWFAGGATAGYATPSIFTRNTVDCDKPVTAVVAPDGTFTVTLVCIGPPPAAPSTSPTASPTATPKPTTPAPTTPAPTTPAPTTPPATTPPPTTQPPATTPPATTPPTTPPPTTPPGSRPLNCWPTLAACGYPTQANTGIRPILGALTKYNGDLVIRTGGTWQNLDITGCVSVQTTAAVVLRNIKVTPANPNAGCQGNISKFNGGTLLIEDVTSYCTVASGHGFYVKNTTARRVQTYGCENGFEVNENSVITDSWIASAENPKKPGGDPHGDDIQSQGGNNVLIQHNTFAGVQPKTSSIITNPTGNHGWTIENNFLTGGAYTLYCAEEGTNWIVRNNRFYPAKTGSPYSASYGLTDECNDSRISWTGNFNDANGRTVNANGATV